MKPTTTSRSTRPIIWLASGATAAGLAFGVAGVAHADNNTSTTSSPTSDPATPPNGPGETVLTGDQATQVKAAVDKALPGATIIRLETDSDERVYEAHVKKADGSVVTLYFTSSHAADGQDDGFGAHDGDGHGQRGPDGRRGHHGTDRQGGAQGGTAPASGQSAPQTNSGGSA